MIVLRSLLFNLVYYANIIIWMICVLPSLLLFIVTPLMLRSGFGFWSSLVAGCAATLVGYAATVASLRWWAQH